MRRFVVHACLAGLFVLALIGPARGAPLDGREAVDDVFYQFMPIAWRDSNNDTYRFGDFGGMTASLDYLEELGVTAVWMNPIFPSPAYHGYQHGAADQLNSWFGTEPEFLDFVQQAHARGIKILVDYVVYGISQNSTWFQSAYNNPSSPYDTWLAFTNASNTQYQGSVYTSWNGNTVGFINWDLRDPNPVNLVTTWAEHWLDPNNDGDPSDGIDGYRLDHVWVNYGYGPDGWGYNLDDFWIPWKAALQMVNPDVFTFAEQADWGTTGADLLPAFDATMTKPFEFAARDALANEQASGLYSSMAATLAALPAGKTFVGIIGDHDVDRLASVIGSSFSKGKAAAAILLTQPFPPIIYYGDEIGMLGVKGDYGSDANDIPMREPFKWNAVAGPPMSNYFALNSQAYSNRYSQNNDGRSVEEQDGASGSLLEEYKQLIAARKAHVALRRGEYYAVPAVSSRIWAFLRYHVDETLLVAINVRGSTVSTSLDLSNTDIPGGATTVQNVLTGAYLSNLTDANKAAYPLSLPAYGYAILDVDVTPLAPEPELIDGTNIPADHGAEWLVATQDNATALGDNVSELDQLFVRPGADGVYIGITGNLATDGTALALAFDSAPGGQNPLDTGNLPAPPNGIAEMDGLLFDSGFTPDTFYWINAYGGTIYVDQVYLPTGSPATKTYRGNGTVNDGDGYLSGGSNPNGLEAALNNSNTAGVTDIDASGAATATTGFELFVPYADIGVAGYPRGGMGVAAFVVRTSGEVSNQWLPGLGGGYDNLGLAPDMETIAGQQFAIAPLDVPGDGDGDADVDAADYPYFFDCQTAPDAGAIGAGCNLFDFDGDVDVDLIDFASFQARVFR